MLLNKRKMMPETTNTKMPAQWTSKPSTKIWLNQTERRLNLKPD